MIHIRSTLAFGPIIAALAVAGCAKHETTIAPPTHPNPAPLVVSDTSVRVQTLSRLVDEYARTANQLPGSNSVDHRRIMAQVFAELEQILPMLEGPNQGAEFRQQLQVVRDAQAELATGPQDLSSEPMIDTGLRATRDALAAIAQAPYYDQSSLTPLFNAFSQKINDLDTVRGPLHQVVTGEAVAVSSQLVSAMADTLSKRLTGESPATTAPARDASGK